MIQERIKLGPIHHSLPGAMILSLGMYGDRIREIETEFGFSKRSIVEYMIGKPHVKALLRFGRIDPENSFLLDRLFCEGIEKITHTSITERTLWIREITTSISELNGFLRYLSRMSSRLGIEVLNHVILKHRESLLDLIELLTGSRYGYYYVVPGGVRYDLTEGFQERLEKWIKNFTQDFPRIEALFRWTHPIQNRLQSLGRVVDNGSFGFVSESSVETTRYGLMSNVESRLLYALNQTQILCDELQTLLPDRSGGETLSPLGEQRFLEPVQIELETARGPWKLSLSVNSDLTVKSVVTELPSDLIITAIGAALENEYFEDLPIILDSLNFSIPEIDR
jgi:NADH:ubiquinone oxidoreductase subunit D